MYTCSLDTCQCQRTLYTTSFTLLPHQFGSIHEFCYQSRSGVGSNAVIWPCSTHVGLFLLAVHKGSPGSLSKFQKIFRVLCGSAIDWSGKDWSMRDWSGRDWSGGIDKDEKSGRNWSGRDYQGGLYYYIAELDCTGTVCTLVK